MLRCIKNFCKKTRDPENSKNNEEESETNRLSNISLFNTSQKYIQYSSLMGFIAADPLLRGIASNNLEDLLSLFEKLLLGSEKVLIKQNETLTKLFILESGNCEILKNSKFVNVVSKGAVLGEKCLISSYKSECQVKTSCKSKFWVLDKQKFQMFSQVFRAKNKSLIASCFKDFQIFSYLPLNIINAISEECYLIRYNENENICKEGDDFRYFIFLKSGKVDYIMRGKIVCTIYKGHLFEEMPLLAKSANKRNNSIISRDESEVILVGVETVKNLIGKNYRNIFLKYTAMYCLSKDEFARYLPKDSLNLLLDKFVFKEHQIGQLAIDKTPRSCYYVICNGKIKSSVNSYSIYSFIGFENENYLKLGTGKYKCQRRSIIGTIEIKEIEKAIKTDVNAFIRKARLLTYYKTIQFFENFDQSFIENFIIKCKTKEYKKGEIIYSSGDSDNFVYLLQEGIVGIFENNNFIIRHDAFCIFGEECLVINSRINTAEALTKVLLLNLPRKSLSELLTPKINLYLAKTVYYINPFQLESIKFLKKIRSFKDRDYLICCFKDSEINYLAEVVYKKKIHDVDSFKSILHQKCVLSQIQHPHIPRFLRNFSDKNCVYFFYEYLEFETLSNIIKSVLPESIVKFLFLNILCILEYLHHKNILHRDLNPRNIYIDTKGYAKLGGFHYSKEGTRSFTMLDTSIEYKDKEVLNGKGYTKSSELWSCGVILFEMLAGKLPFNINEDDSYLVKTDKILNSDIRNFTENLKEENKHIISGLMRDDPINRSKIDDIIKSPWAREIDFYQIYNQEIAPEFIPNVEDFSETKFLFKFDPTEKLSHEDKKNKTVLPWDNYF